jgi:predicted nucleotidyltransferase
MTFYKKVNNMESTENRLLPYFAILKNKLIVFIVFELRKENLFIGFPKLLPAVEESNIKIDGNNYTRYRGYDVWFRDSFLELDKYIRHVPAFGEKLYCFPSEEIERIIHPLDYFELQSKYSNDIDYLVDILSKRCNVPREAIGVEGSQLLGYARPESDIDILIYGFENGKKLKEHFIDVLSSYGVKGYDASQYKSIIENRKAIGYGDTDEAILKQELRRFYGFIGNKRFSIVNVLGDESFNEYINLDRELEFKQVVNSNFKIIDDKFSFMTPSKYQLVNSKGENYTLEIISHYGTNQAKRGESFYIQGKQYDEINTGKKVIILSFWSGIEEKFNIQISNSKNG